jgi:hypothetical protein
VRVEMMGFIESPCLGKRMHSDSIPGDRGRVRVRVAMMRSQTYRIVGKSQSVLIMIGPITFTRTRTDECMPCGAARAAPRHSLLFHRGRLRSRMGQLLEAVRASRVLAVRTLCWP